jgi:hypothetical protein
MKTISIIFVFLLSIQFTGIACSCAVRQETNEDVKLEFKNSNYVLDFTILETVSGPTWKKQEDGSVNLLGQLVILRAKVNRVFKGKLESDTITLSYFADGGASCSFGFSENQRYLFYGGYDEKSQTFKTTICSRSERYNGNGLDIQVLNEITNNAR